MSRSVWATLTRQGQRPVLLGIRSSTYLIVFTVGMAIFTDLFPYAVIVPVLPYALPDRTGVAADKVQHLISISLAVFGVSVLVFSPIWGVLADRIQSRRGPMLAGLFLLGASTLLLTLMSNVTMLIVGRVLQGATGALTWAVGLALVVDTVDPKHLGQAMGWIGTALSWASLSAPLLGGVVYGKGGWYQVWAMCYALIAGDIVLRLVIIEKKHAKKWLFVESEPVSRSTSDDKEKGQASMPSIHPDDEIATAVLGTGHVSARGALALLKNPRLIAAFWGCVVESSIQTAFDAIIPLQVETLFGWDSVGAGLIFLPFIIPTFLSPLAGSLGDRYGAKWLTSFGFFLSTPFLACLRFVSENTIGHKVMLCGLLFGVGLGITCTMGPLMAEISWSMKDNRNRSRSKNGNQDLLERERQPTALAYALYNVAYAAGCMIGPLLGGFIRDQHGWPTVGWVLAILTFFTGATSLAWIGGPLKIEPPHSTQPTLHREQQRRRASMTAAEEAQREKQQHIDALLQRYLVLLDEYTGLRAELSRLQAGVYQDLARANFAAERGMRYGADHYDERMRALRALRVEAPSLSSSSTEEGPARFTVEAVGGGPRESTEEDRGREEGGEPASTVGGSDGQLAVPRNEDEDEDAKDEQDVKREESGGGDDKKSEPPRKVKDPLRWFGLLTPAALRAAQARSVEAVERVIPRLASVDAEMAAVEIEVRRARKKRAKALAAAGKAREADDTAAKSGGVTAGGTVMAQEVEG
ncbi:major facilitator superfamily domain, general substrate transporter [Purpureocillium lavendulum]|uniref:Major facilitator superfamily domain, general substrate transporter n=1 Tax=Purpureocillium lavendulum TaxID=1247861 RepID=A0AB34G0L3_9HYPO|nr:major facilitator superfamily domain, general substrate transporter [Purpureocillium lavendulum]